MSRRIRFALFSLCLFVGSRALAGTLDVPKNHPDIQSALNAAGPGDTIRIAAGTYFGKITISKDGVRLLGQGEVILDGRIGKNPAGGVVVVNAASGVRLENLVIRHASGFDPIGVKGTLCPGLTLEKVTILGSAGAAVNVTGANVALRHCTLRGNATGATIGGDDARIEDCAIRNTSGEALKVTGAGAIVRHVEITACGGGGIIVFGADARVEKSIVKGTLSGDAIRVSGDHPQVVFNTIEGTRGASAITVAGAAGGGSVVSNHVRFANADGIVVGPGCAHVEVRSNKVEDGGAKYGTGFRISGTEIDVANNSASRLCGDGFRVLASNAVRLDKNVASDNLADGFEIVSGAQGLHFAQNKALKNRGEGIQNQALGAELIQNTSKGNRTDFVNGGTLGPTSTGNAFGTTGVAIID